jgi:hypothetical protein
MSGLVIIPRTDLRKSFVPPMPAWGRDTSGALFIRCACGICMGIDDHTVDAAGNVTPSLWHDEPGCGWHVWGQLEGWTP